jgi:hypothetical protein
MIPGGAGPLCPPAVEDAPVWTDESLQATFSAFTEDYDVAEVEEQSLSASKHYGW